MSDKKELQRVREKLRRRATELAAARPILQGTVTERTITRSRGKRGEAAKIYGPYYQWTFKQAGKTVTVNLTSEQAHLVREAIENNRKVERALEEIRRLSRHICESAVRGVKRRKPAKA